MNFLKMFKSTILLIFFISQAFSQIELQQYATIYLKTFGYMYKQAVTNTSDAGDKIFTDSLKNFQRDAGVNETGNMDQETISMMVLPRCSSTDKNLKTEDFDKVEWEGGEISYCFSKYPRYLKENYVDTEAAKAFKYWGQHLNFAFHPIKAGCDIEIRFVSFKELNIPRMSYGVYSHPSLVRKIYMNDDLQWSIEGDEEVNLRSALVHQIGHALGFDHMNSSSIMSPIYKKSNNNISLTLTKEDPIFNKINSTYDLQMDFCSLSSIDALFQSANKQFVYIFKNQYYWKTFSNKTLINKEPQLIADRWTDIKGKVDAAFQDKLGYTYIFSNGTIWKYFENLLDQEYPKAIKDVFSQVGEVQFIIQNTTHTILGNSDIFVYERDRKYDNNLKFIIKYPNKVKNNNKVFLYPNSESVMVMTEMEYETQSLDDFLDEPAELLQDSNDFLDDYEC